MFPNFNFNGSPINNMNINQGAYQAFLNMMQMNQNFNPNNQNDLNNLMMQFMLLNPNFFQVNNNPQQNAYFNPMQFINNIPQPNNNNINPTGGVLPRINQINNSNDYIDDFPGHIGQRINITFETGTGIKKNIATPLDVTVGELLSKFTKRVGVSESLIQNKLFFVINGETIDKNKQKKKVEEFFTYSSNFLNSQFKIIVLDASNVIGA